MRNRDFLFGSNPQPAPQGWNVLEALLRQGVLNFLQCFKTEKRKHEIKVRDMLESNTNAGIRIDDFRVCF